MLARRPDASVRLLMFSYIVATLPFFSTLAGGVAALRLRHRLHPIMALAAGVLVATAVVTLLPESLELLGRRAPLTGAFAMVGFLAFTGLEAQLHRHAWEHEHEPGHAYDKAHEHRRQAFGILSAGWLMVHSFLDGLAIGAGFSTSRSLGLLVALAVVAHDFADGLNVVTLSLKTGSRLVAVVLLVLDALAPLAGASLALVTTPPPALLGALLGVFGGAFIALGAGHLLPEAQHLTPSRAPRLVLIAAVGAGAVLLARHVLGD